MAEQSQSRKLFEEIPAKGNQSPAEPSRPATAETRQAQRRAIAIWLWSLIALLVIMIILGGLTRQTQSGLSITSWAPIMGILPPLSLADWQEAFAAYQKIPEYTEINHWMELEDFKVIFWWEWSHRFLGRIIGLIWAFGLLYFVLRKAVPRGWTWRLTLPGLLGGLQGAVGWWMVSSGLSERVDVSHLRLATHLGLAFIILHVLLAMALKLGHSEAELLRARRASERRLRIPAVAILHLLFLQIILGALAAGLNSGQLYTDWPLMNGAFLPSESFELTPWIANFWSHPALVQFEHRLLAYGLTLLVLLLMLRSWRAAPAIRLGSRLLLLLTAVQILLAVVMLSTAVSILTGALHQLCGVAIYMLAITVAFDARYPREQAIGRG